MAHDITPADAHHVAKLARFSLTEDEAAQYAKELGRTLDWVDQLNELNLDGVEPLVHALDQTNILREDQPAEPLSPDDALSNAPQRFEDFFQVPKILGQGGGA